MSAITRWWWVRHAPVVAEAGRLYGQTDLACDTSDRQVIAAVAALLPDGAVWVTSHLRRTLETAAALTTARNGIGVGPRPAEGTAPLVEADLAEQAFGTWQGLTWTEIEAREPDRHRAFWRDPGRNSPPQGESLAQVLRRVATVVERLTRGHAGRDIVAVAHGGSIRAALALALGIDPGRSLALQIDNLSLTRIDHVPERLAKGHANPWRVLAVNRLSR